MNQLPYPGQKTVTVNFSNNVRFWGRPEELPILIDIMQTEATQLSIRMLQHAINSEPYEECRQRVLRILGDIHIARSFHAAALSLPLPSIGINYPISFSDN